MFKVGDKVRFVGKWRNPFNTEVINVEGFRIWTKDMVGWVGQEDLELIKEEKPVSTNPCIATEEVKIVKTKFTAGRLYAGAIAVFDLRPSTIPGDVYLDASNCRNMASVSADSLRKLARQLDEIANVLETKE